MASAPAVSILIRTHGERGDVPLAESVEYAALRDEITTMRERVNALQRQADELAQARTEVLAQLRQANDAIYELGQQAAKLEADELRNPRPATGRTESDTINMARILKMLAQHDGISMTPIVQELGISSQTCRRLMRAMEIEGRVRRTGLKRGTRWHLVGEDGQTSKAVSVNDGYRERVRDAAQQLGTFTRAELVNHLPDISDQTVVRYLRHMEQAGILDATRVGQAKLYDFLKPEATATTRRKMTAVEVETARQFGLLAADRSGERVSGRRVRTGNKRSDQALAKAQRAGARVKVLANNHVRVDYNGQTSRVALTPSRGSSMRDRDKLRKMGLEL